MKPLLPLLSFLLVGCVVPIGGLGSKPNVDQPPASAGTWQRVASGLTSALHDVQFVGPAAGFAVGEGGVLIKTFDGLAWQRFDPAPLAGKDLRSISMVDAGLGFVTTDRSVLKTTDGGTTWSLALDLQETYADRPYRARFLDAQRGWVVGQAGLYQTTDGGATWREQGPPIGYPEHRPGDVRGVGGQTWAWGEGSLYKLFEGVGWATMLDPAASQPSRCRECPAAAAFPTATDAWFYGGREGRLYHSADAGLTWSSVPFVDRKGDAVTPGGTLPVNSEAAVVAFPDAQHGWVLAANTLLSTEDGGKSWTTYETPRTDGPDARARQFFPADARALEMVSAQVGWAAGRGGMLARFTR